MEGKQSRGVGSTQSKRRRLSENNTRVEQKSPNASVDPVSHWNSVDFQTTTDKALRGAMLKSRYANIIFKAKHQIEKLDFKTMQRDKEILEREKRRDKARVDAEYKEAVLQKRESDRAAARIAIQSIKKSVEINDAMDIMKDFEDLINISKTLVSHIGNAHRECPCELREFGV